VPITVDTRRAPPTILALSQVFAAGEKIWGIIVRSVLFLVTGLCC